ncbi:hypothetical protein IKF30_00930 [Candidatus Saccharibacteria bacterium]|nr:hypothetical protein [Candidatus Saccharibacteria bacterium]
MDESKPKNKSIKYIIIAIIGVLLLVGIGVGVAIAMSNNGDKGTEPDNSGDTSTATEENDEETKRITEETIKKYTDIKVEGYRDVEDNSVNGKAVVVSVHNISEEVVSLAIVMGAYDQEGNLLDTSSLYAEGIQPDQTHVFNTFVYSELTPKQLESATYKVYKAHTYNAEGVETSSEGEATTEEETTTEEASGEEASNE